MLLRSLKGYLYLVIFIIILQLLLVGINLYLQSRHDQVEDQQNTFVKNASFYLENLSLEKDIEDNPKSQEELLNRYEILIKASEINNLGFNTPLLKQRIQSNNELFKLFERRSQLHARINEILPALAQSVTFIHEHHLAYLKNNSRHGTLDKSQINPNRFTKKATEPASELDIVSVAIEIQSSMIEIMEVFSRLQRGISPNIIQDDFSDAITAFFKATSRFEDFSVDAQDGLLVEELIMEGNTFEESFKNFLQLEQSILNKKNELQINQASFLNDISTLKEKNLSYYESITSNLETITKTSLVISILLMLVLLFLGKWIIAALTRTGTETQRIQRNIDYRIPEQKQDFNEFIYIYKTLNHMAETVGEKLEELSQAQAQLEETVAKRTEELSETNQQLQTEIDERIKNETQRRKLEEKLSRAEKMEALGALAGGVAHDLNNILSGIVSYPELLLMDLPDDSPLRKPLETIKSSGDKATVIVQDLLTMARRGVAKQTPLNLKTTIEELLNSAECKKMLSHHLGVSLEKNFSAEMTTLYGSKVHIQKTLINLITNAAESITGKGRIHITLTNEYVDTVFKSYDEVNEGEYLKLRIQDTGIGISAENLEKIFEPFYTTKIMGRSGSGLGMAVVWGTVKDHGGYIDVTSRQMEGTTFDLYFPLLRSSAELDSIDDNPELLQAKGETVLVIDDIKEQREIASMMLDKIGYLVDTVESGETAIDYLKYNKADILVLDMIMSPGIDGLETYRQILQINPTQKAIIVSGFSESEKVLEAQQLGTGPYVKKPYTIQELATALRNELDK